jgi:hypothetical protein
MKTFNRFILEANISRTDGEPKSEDEKRFKDKHVMQVTDYPVPGTSDVLNAKTMKKDMTKAAGYHEADDEKVYESFVIGALVESEASDHANLAKNHDLTAKAAKERAQLHRTDARDYSEQAFSEHDEYMADLHHEASHSAHDEAHHHAVAAEAHHAAHQAHKSGASNAAELSKRAHEATGKAKQATENYKRDKNEGLDADEDGDFGRNIDHTNDPHHQD